MSFSVGGLATGLDTKSIISQLMSIETRPKTKLEWNRSLWDARKSGWNDLNTRLNSLQKFANTLMSPATWTVGAPSGTGAWAATSSVATQVTASVTGTPAAGTYGIEVQQIAQGEISISTGALGPATAGVRRTGAFYEGNNNIKESTDLVRTIRQQNGTVTGIGTGSTIAASWTVNGITSNANFAVTSTATMTDLANWVATQVGGGATASFVNGEIHITTAPGTANELTALSFTATNSGGASLPNFNSLAGAASSTLTAATDGGVTAADTLTITQGANVWNVALAQGDQIADIVSKINATGGIGVTASVAAGALRIASNSQGATEAFTVTSAGATAAQLGFSETQAAQNAQYTVNGTGYSSTTNFNVAGAIADVSLNLLQPTTGPVTLTVGQGTPGSSPEEAWREATKNKINDFVAQYNNVMDFIAQKTGESRMASPKNLGDYLQGPLARDQGFSSVGMDLRKMVGDVVGGLASGSNLLTDIGISSEFVIGSSTNGRLVVDEAKLDAALQADPAKVQSVLGNIGAGTGITTDDGVARKVSELISQLRSGGRVDMAIQGATNQMKSTQTAIDRMSDRLERKQLYYDKMFANLETTIGRINSQQGWLTGQFQQMANNAGF